MTGPFYTVENRHHLLLDEARQVNEFLDARLTGAEVPEGQRLAVARSVLELALGARERTCAPNASLTALAFLSDLPENADPSVSGEDAFLAWANMRGFTSETWVALLLICQVIGFPAAYSEGAE